MIAPSARAAVRVAHATVSTLSTIGEARRVRRPTRPAQAVALGEACAAMCRIHGITVRQLGATPAGPCVLVPNHVSYLDPLAILACSPALPLAKAEVAAWPLIGPTLTSLGGIYVRRDEPMARARALRAALRVLAAGAAVLNFPEGTTTDGSRLLPFHRGIFGIAIHARVPVVPVTITFDDPRCAWTGDARFVPHYWWLAGRRDTVVTVRFGASLLPHQDESARGLADRTRATIARGLTAAPRVAATASPLMEAP